MRTDLRIIKTKEALHTALLDLLNEKDLQMVSISELCRKAKINRGTFYLHYGQVEDVFGEYFKEITEDLTQSYQEPYRYVTVLKTSELNPSTIRIFHHIDKYQPFYRIVFSKKVPLTYYYLLFDKVKQLLLEDNQSLETEGVNLELFSAYQANAIIGMIIDWYQHDFSYSVSYLNQQLVTFLNLK
ncbi:AcrR family transcriptional regulator [Pullulanibacillus pueri]|uniref:TetR family transcriptional regulator n=1 Tax=Pullulanibacillus pueri TaxID=1437324 RepID=A0A8J3EMQ0_9BACL|nr:TetR/AcrR family transcriptional regulator [Pullulanibacillus pueri]MBM7680965.1 AcrR family transcriptional regulator [Pullulanibacillus pueri]GGH81521.1 TetR family transcriptional regulator [Pullulanibacillus pueri]